MHLRLALIPIIYEPHITWICSHEIFATLMCRSCNLEYHHYGPRTDIVLADVETSNELR
jgi:hypothetical protein